MYEKFIALKEEKRNRIVNAAMDEFAAKGYEAASTNVIVERAGISKGALFHYFPTKKALFLFLCDYTLEVVRREYINRIDVREGDILARYKQACVVKLAMLGRYPHLFDFIQLLATEDCEEINGLVRQRVEKTAAHGFSRLTQGLDTSFFRKDIPAQRIQEMIFWVINGYGEKITQQAAVQPLSQQEAEELGAEFDSYLDTLRLCFYQEEREGRQ